MARPPTRQQIRPPDLGSFPLDHLSECRDRIEAYYVCLGEHNNLAPKCREEAREYLQCRMDRGLMTPEPTERWLPQTVFVDNRQDVARFVAQMDRSESPLLQALALRDIPHGREVEREGAIGGGGGAPAGASDN
eukprot:TRINITY_DN28839_c0_g2_i1.p3 TRINITY_DN28839_c0_g2~~TRINITY_DN28839_c0_g2_i1.p3  ORF type:complete len:148 (+),score=24.68 TRINITY_DN28839_c0_g2_i1:43-444(+)